MKKQSNLINLTLLFVSLIICFIITEIGLRVIIYSNIPFLNNIPILSKQRNPACYASSDHDDYWKIHYKVYGLPHNKSSQSNPHPVLGWTGNFSNDNFIHNEAINIGNRRPILLYGDSFTNCIKSQTCYQDFLNNDRVFSQNNILLNYGVNGYGVDQIYLLFKNSVDLYNNPFVIIGIYTMDLDRSVLSLFSNGMKPHFRVEKNTLKLDGEPLLDPDTFVQQNPPEIPSYLLRRITVNKFSKKVLPKQFISYLTNSDHIHKKKLLINEKIILETIKELRVRNLDFVFIIFETVWRGSENNDINWRELFLKQILENNDATYIWTRTIVKENSSDANFSHKNFFIPKDGHPTTYLNGLISEKIKEYVID